MSFQEKAIEALRQAEHLENAGSPGTLEAAKVVYLRAIGWAILAAAVELESLPKER